MSRKRERKEETMDTQGTNWGELLNDCKSICGVLKLEEPVSVYCLTDKKEEKATRITFPPNQKGIDTLIAVSQPAVFGLEKEQKNVLDTSYRKAKSLSTSDFLTNFVPPLSLLKLVRNAFVPTDEIEARLYKLNIYGEKDFFKPHVDTTRGVTMFGSLVVSLPCKFEGGELVVGVDAKYPLCSTSPQELRWVAFISDTPHEVLPITQGYRITLTYNLHRAPLYHISETLGPSVKETAIYKALQQYKESHPDHAWLAFNCQHSYTNEQLVEAKKAPLEILRGSDLRLALAVEAIGGKFAIVGLYRDNCEGTTFTAKINAKVVLKVDYEDENTYLQNLMNEDVPPFLKSYDYVDKRLGGNQIMGAVVGSYGNYFSMNGIYYSAVMTVQLTSNMPPQDKKEKEEEKEEEDEDKDKDKNKDKDKDKDEDG